MKDKLKDFVSEHRDEFDVFEPRPELWQEICQELPEPWEEKEGKVIKIRFGERASFSADFFFMRVAAAILLLLSCGLTLFLMKQQAATEGQTVATLTKSAGTQSIAPELAEVEAYYVSQIQEKKSQLSEYDLKVLGLDEQQEIDRELARLDSSYTQLKKQLYTNPNTDEIVGAMVQNLQIRIKVLNRQLEVLQKIEQLEQEPSTEPKNDDSTNV